MDKKGPSPISVRIATQQDTNAILNIAKALPEWFTPKGINLIKTDLQFQNGLCAELDSKVIGFITFFVNEARAQIGWMGVLPEYQRQHIGKQLLTQLCENLKRANVTEIQVHTLGDSVDYAPYEKTRLFYRSFGFKDFKTISNPENPAYEEELILRLEI